jgi:dTDP-4-amino-4,6-dideoxygalactose transaminase
MTRVFLSPPDVGHTERKLLLDAFDSNWIAPLGPHVDAFEQEMAAAVGMQHAVALSSGTAALHLALLLAGVVPGDEVLVPTLTFVATANAVTYVGAKPVFVDCEGSSWNIDPNLVTDELERRDRAGTQVGAVITVDLYGQCADHDPIRTTCERLGVPVIEDAAEALGASYRGRPAGSLGDAAVLSFNGNKIITTSGGGMYVTNREDWATRARHLATQAREPGLHYEHAVTGFNYRMSNLLAALGRGQLGGLEGKVTRRRQINAAYRARLDHLPGIAFMPKQAHGEPTWWLTALTIDPQAFGADRDVVIARMEEADIEARPTWKPMHLQPLFAGASRTGGRVAADIFAQGICLPSGSALDAHDLDRIIEIVAGCHRP